MYGFGGVGLSDVQLSISLSLSLSLSLSSSLSLSLSCGTITVASNCRSNMLGLANHGHMEQEILKERLSLG